MKSFLWKQQVLLKDFGAYVESVSDQVKEAAKATAERLGRPFEYLPSASENKEERALKIMRASPVEEGLIGVLRAVEPCMSFEIVKNASTRRLEIHSRTRKCLHLYFYMIDPQFGFMNARIQTWFPFRVQICINGREWLSRELDRRGVTYDRRDNCFAAIGDVTLAQELLDQQVDLNWPSALNRIAKILNPLHTKILGDLQYYWSVYQSEWATDVMFRSREELVSVYDPLVLHAIRHFGARDVMRFLGKKPPGGCPYRGEVVSSFQERPEGVRVRHSVGQNSVKVYDKQRTVLRVETTIHDARGFKTFRAPEGKPKGKKTWRPLRRGVADIRRRVDVSQAANERYLEAVATVSSSTTFGALLQDIVKPSDLNGRRVRGLRPWCAQDLALLRAVNRGEFALNGFRNSDLQGFLYVGEATAPLEGRRRSARTSRLIRLLRAHGLVRRVPKTHRNRVTEKGREILTAILAAQNLSLDVLNKAA
jgi:hypothetical protein